MKCPKKNIKVDFVMWWHLHFHLKWPKIEELNFPSFCCLQTSQVIFIWNAPLFPVWFWKYCFKFFLRHLISPPVRYGPYLKEIGPNQISRKKNMCGFETGCVWRYALTSEWKWCVIKWLFGTCDQFCFSVTHTWIACDHISCSLNKNRDLLAAC